jgi:hypothetical protein
VTARHPKQIAALRMRSEVLSQAVIPDVPIRWSICTSRKASTVEIQECLTFTGHADPMMSKIAIERLLDHLQACGLVLMSKDDARQSWPTVADRQNRSGQFGIRLMEVVGPTPAGPGTSKNQETAMSDQNQTPATAIAAYSLWWGLAIELGKKGVLSKQEIMNGLDSSLHFLETNQSSFADQPSVETARMLVESLMNVFRGTPT